MADVEPVRPMLAVGRAEVVAYLHDLGQDYREDATNADTTRTRSRIRHDLLPLLAKNYNPRVVAALGRLAVQAADWRCDQAAATEELLRAAERPRAGPILIFDRTTLAAAPRRRRRAMWRAVWSARVGPAKTWAFANGTASPHFVAAAPWRWICPAACESGGAATSFRLDPLRENANERFAEDQTRVAERVR